MIDTTTSSNNIIESELRTLGDHHIEEEKLIQPFKMFELLLVFGKQKQNIFFLFCYQTIFSPFTLLFLLKIVLALYTEKCVNKMLLNEKCKLIILLLFWNLLNLFLVEFIFGIKLSLQHLVNVIFVCASFDHYGLINWNKLN